MFKLLQTFIRDHVNNKKLFLSFLEKLKMSLSDKGEAISIICYKRLEQDWKVFCTYKLSYKRATYSIYVKYLYLTNF